MSDEVAYKLADVPYESVEKDAEIHRIAARLSNNGMGRFLIVYGTNRLCMVEHGIITLARFDANGQESDMSYHHCRDTMAAAIIKCFEDQSDTKTLLLHASAARHLASQTSKYVCKNLCQQLLISTAQKGNLLLKELD